MRFTALTAALLALTINAAAPSYAEQPAEPNSSVSEQQQSSLQITKAWSRELPPTALVGAAFLQIENHSEYADRLISAKSSIAEVTELHAHIHEGDVMRMVKVDSIDVPAHGQLTLEPGGYHIMLIDLKQPLVAGEQLLLTLQFEQAGQMDISVDILSSDAGTSAEHADHDTMDHSSHMDH